MEQAYETSKLVFDQILQCTMKTVHRYLDMVMEHNLQKY